MRRSGADSPAGFVQLVVDELGGATARLEGQEARHLARSLRAHTGETYRATDGRGLRAEVVVGAVTREGIELEVLHRHLEPEPARRFWLATRCDASRLEWLCEKAAELGAWGLLPIAGGIRTPRPDRLRRLARAALGQSLGAWELQVEEERPLAAVLAGTPRGGAWTTRLWATPEGGALAELPPPGPGDHLLLVGPPEGFQGRESALLQGLSDVGRVRLGERRLRSETAALALLAWVSVLGAPDVRPGGFGAENRAGRG